MAMGIGAQALGSLTGNIEKAVLVIDDYRAFAAKVVQSTTPSADSLAAMGPAAALKAKAEAAKRLAKTMESAKKLNAGKATAAPTNQNKRKIYHVQFNPSSFSINASADVALASDATGGEPSQDAQENPEFTLDVVLLFNEVTIYDCFMAERFTGGLSVQGAKNVAAAIMKNAKGKVWSVQDEVEGLIAALRNPYTRNISFRWTDFCFTGELVSVWANYKMFSTEGRPVHAEVRLRIHHSVQKKDLARWYAAYGRAFPGGAASATKVGQKMGNLLNLNF